MTLAVWLMFAMLFTLALGLSGVVLRIGPVPIGIVVLAECLLTLWVATGSLVATIGFVALAAVGAVAYNSAMGHSR